MDVDLAREADLDDMEMSPAAGDISMSEDGTLQVNSFSTFDHGFTTK